jgi:hypothetical protein
MLFGKRREKDGRWPRFGSETNIACFQCLTSGTQPRAKRRRMSRRLMMGMMRRVGHDLRVDQSTENQQADREAGGKHMMDRPGHGYGNKADREAVCVSRLTISWIFCSVSVPPLMYSCTTPRSSIKTLTGKP